MSNQHGLIRSEVFTEEEQRRRAAIEETRGLEVFDPADLERVEGGDGLLVHAPDGSLWVQTSRGTADLLGREAVRVVFEGSPLTPRYLVRADEAIGGTPGTLEEWLDRRDRKAAAVEQGRKDAEAKAERRRARAEPVTFDDLAHDGQRITLRQAAEAVVKAGGTIKVESSRLVVSLPPGATIVLGSPSPAAKAARRLYTAEAEVVVAAGKGGEVNPAKLPARAILPSGALAP
jgi:hypothetical protein